MSTEVVVENRIEKLLWRGDLFSRLSLGTAQLGMDYGIANRGGKPDLELAGSIVQTALAEGIDFFDTAQGYSDSETLLGVGLCSGVNRIKASIVTKISPEVAEDPEHALLKIKESITKLETSTLFAVLLHSKGNLSDWNISFLPTFQLLKSLGLTRYIGVSIYSDDEMEFALNTPEIDVIQLPFNVFDQRALINRWFDRAATLNKLLIVRSIFLQGLLLLDSSRLPETMDFVRQPLSLWHDLCQQSGLALNEACLGWAFTQAKGAAIVFGAETPLQIVETARIAKSWIDREFPVTQFSQMADIGGLRLRNPSLWPRDQVL